MNKNKRKLMDLIAQRKAHIDAAQDALDNGNQEAYSSEMAIATGMNDEIAQLQQLVDEAMRFAGINADHVPEGNPDAINEAVRALRSGGRMDMPMDLVVSTIRGAVNSVLIGTDSLAQPTGVGTNIHDNNAAVSSILGMVNVQNLEGCAEWQEPYVKKVSTASVGTDGNAPAISEPVFRVAAIKPTLINTVAYVSKHINNLTPVAYYNKVQALALDALRRKVVEMMTNGNGTFFGFKNAKNTKNEVIYATKSVDSATIGETFLRDLVLGSGGDETVGNGVLQLNKADLVAFGDVRGTNEKKAVYEIIPDASTNGNTGVIIDGGLSVPYVINSNLTALSGSTKGASAIQTMIYGDPYAYMLGLFSKYTVEVSTDYKFAERLYTVLGEVMAGGNLCKHEAVTVVELAANG